MKFLFLGKAIDEASTRYRVQPIMGSLAEEGYETNFRSTDLNWFQKLTLLRDAPTFDLVFIQRKLFSPFYIKLLRNRANKLVFDFDDAVFVKSSGHSSSSRFKKFQAVCAAADLVIAGNEYLSEYAAQAGANNIQLVPTSVAVDDYEMAGAIEKHEPFTLVWIGSSSTRRYLDLLTPVLDWLAAEVDGIQLKVIADFEFRLESMPVINVRWSAEGEVQELASCHVGIAPMINDAWTRGKCALKVLQYMAAGLPVVSSNSGANKEVIISGETGYLAEVDEDWVNAVKRLAESNELRQKLGAAGRRRAEEHFSLADNAERTTQAICGLVR